MQNRLATVIAASFGAAIAAAQKSGVITNEQGGDIVELAGDFVVQLLQGERVGVADGNIGYPEMSLSGANHAILDFNDMVKMLDEIGNPTPQQEQGGYNE